MILRSITKLKKQNLNIRHYLTYDFHLLNFNEITKQKTKKKEEVSSNTFSYGVFSNLGMVNGVNKKLSDTATKATDAVLTYLNSSYFHINKIFENEIFSLDEIYFENLKTKYTNMQFLFKYQTESDITGFIDVTIDFDGRKLELKNLRVLNEKKEEIYTEKPNYFLLTEEIVN